MTNYDIVYMVAIVSAVAGAIVAFVIYRVDKNANSKDV